MYKTKIADLTKEQLAKIINLQTDVELEKDAEIKKLKAENEKLRKCVGFYGCEKHWAIDKRGNDIFTECDLDSLIDDSKKIAGYKARKTLEDLR